MAKNNTFYNGNPKIKKSGIRQKYTKHQLEEYEKCRDDVAYFARNYCKIISLDRGLINFELRDYQERLLKDLSDNRFNVVLTSRQTGKTITTACFLVHYLCFNSYKSIGIVANKGALAREILHRMKRMYEGLPFFLQPGVVEWNKGSVELGNGSSVMAGSTTSDSIRGFTFNMIMVDEAGFIDGFDEFYTSTYPVVASDPSKKSKIILVSTPNGINLFHKIWKDANLGNNQFHPTRVDWHEVPHYDAEWIINNLDRAQLRNPELNELRVYWFAQWSFVDSGDDNRLAYQEILDMIESRHHLQGQIDIIIKAIEKNKPTINHILVTNPDMLKLING